VSTRTIVTSQPDVACDVCARRLLRGEQPDVFLSAGRRLTVCELCAPRAAFEGWQRESQTQALTLPPMRPRRGRSFLARLRQVAARPDAGHEGGGAETRSQPFDFLDPALDGGGTEPDGGLADPGLAFAEFLSDAGPQTPAEEALGRALEAFNLSEFPRRVAGVARSLGAPLVSVRAEEYAPVTIVVAWELCWYRYEVDLDGGGQVLASAQGTELSELTAEEQIGNAAADEHGALVLAGA
jgi:hypothetical protein